MRLGFSVGSHGAAFVTFLLVGIRLFLIKEQVVAITKLDRSQIDLLCQDLKILHSTGLDIKPLLQFINIFMYKDIERYF